MARVNHQPLEVRFLHEQMKEPFPGTLVPPAGEATVGVLPAAVARGQVSPGRARAKDPEDGVDELPVVFCRAACPAFPSRQLRLKEFPLVVGDVVAAVGRLLRHGNENTTANNLREPLVAPISAV